jgi:hypothetical protein
MIENSDNRTWTGSKENAQQNVVMRVASQSLRRLTAIILPFYSLHSNCPCIFQFLRPQKTCIIKPCIIELVLL